MRAIQLSLCLVLLAAGGGWAAWLVTGYRPEDATAAGLGLSVGASFLAYMATDRKDSSLWVRFGLYGGTLAVAAASLLDRHRSAPSSTRRSIGAVMAWLERTRRGGAGGSIVVPGPAVMLLTVLWFEVALAGLGHLKSGDRRRRAESDLHGRATLLGRRFLRRLAKRNGILLGQWGAGRNARLIGWSLEGSAITVAPPRAGKGAVIALNLLSPDYRGFDGSTVTIDPRGELWCIAAQPAPRVGPPRAAARSLRGGGEAQGGLSGVPPARCQPAPGSTHSRSSARTRVSRCATSTCCSTRCSPRPVPAPMKTAGTSTNPPAQSSPGTWHGSGSGSHGRGGRWRRFIACCRWVRRGRRPSRSGFRRKTGSAVGSPTSPWSARRRSARRRAGRTSAPSRTSLPSSTTPSCWPIPLRRASIP